MGKSKHYIAGCKAVGVLTAGVVAYKVGVAAANVVEKSMEWLNEGKNRSDEPLYWLRKGGNIGY